MAELCGSGYVMDHCMSALLAEREKKRDDMLLWYYITDCLKTLTENTAKSVMPGLEGNYIANRYADLASPKPEKPEQSAEDIVRDIFRRAGLKTTKGEEVKEENESV